MTADRPTREERYAAVLAEHGIVSVDGGTATGSRWLCLCGATELVRGARDLAAAQGRAHVAAALVAADPAPVQPECDGSGSCPAPLHIHGCFADTDDARCDDPGDHAPAQPDAETPCVICRRPESEHRDRNSHGFAPAPAQPVPAPEKRDLDTVARTLMAAWERAEGKPVNVSYVATFADMARAVLAVPAPEVSRGVAEVRALADEWDDEGADLIANCSTGRDVHEGDILRRCAAALRDALPAEEES